MFQKLSLSGFKQKKNVSKFEQHFIKNYDEDSNKGYISEVNVGCPKNLLNLYKDLPFLSGKLKNVIRLSLIYVTKKTLLFIRINTKQNTKSKSV